MKEGKLKSIIRRNKSSNTDKDLKRFQDDNKILTEKEKSGKLGRFEKIRKDNNDREIISNVSKGLSPYEQKEKARQSALRKVRRESGEKFKNSFSTPTKEETVTSKKDIFKEANKSRREKDPVILDKLKAKRDLFKRRIRQKAERNR